MTVPDPREAPPLRWGILGAGGIAATFADALLARTRGEAAAVGSRPAPRSSTQRRNTESRKPSSLATDPIERPLEATRSTACRL